MDIIKMDIVFWTSLDFKAYRKFW